MGDPGDHVACWDSAASCASTEDHWSEAEAVSVAPVRVAGTEKGGDREILGFGNHVFPMGETDVGGFLSESGVQLLGGLRGKQGRSQCV